MAKKDKAAKEKPTKEKPEKPVKDKAAKDKPEKQVKEKPSKVKPEKEKPEKPVKEKPPKEKPEKEKPAKGAKNKANQDAVGKKKSDKSVSGVGLEKDDPEQEVADLAIKAKSGSLASKDGDAGGNRNSKSTVPEWESETVRNVNLIEDGFSCCTVLVMEDSPELSKFGEFLLRDVDTGVRRKFNCISGAQTAERVKRFLVSHGESEAVEDDSFLDRQELFAEAIKHTLVGIKQTVTSEIDANLKKAMELAGAGEPTEGIVLERNWEPPPAPPPTVQGAPRSAPSTKGKVDEEISKQNVQEPRGKASIAEKRKSAKRKSKKQEAIPMSEFEVIDESFLRGSRSYILLQGFYNPVLIEELWRIGVKVDGILLMTDAKVERYNFSIMDVEDSIPGAFKPKNALPQYLKAIERQFHNPATRNSEVTQFWSELSYMYNKAVADSPFHDIALLNFPLPDPQSANLDNTEGINAYTSQMFDELAKRVFEMLVAEEWLRKFNSAADVTKLQPLEPILPHDIYDQIIGQIPCESLSVPIILEAVVQQVAASIEKEAGHPVPEPCYVEDITSGIITGKSSFGSTNWGLPAAKGVINKEDNRDHLKHEEHDATRKPSPFQVPMYIKAGDYASIRNCHLNEGIAAKIASCQLSGDMRNIQGFLWQKVPEFNKGLYMKLLGNLNHFMYFMPPDMVQFEDMFYILHLLMSAGVEVHLQKTAEECMKASKTNSIMSKLGNFAYQDDIYLRNSLDGPNNFPGTNLSTDHNYLAVNEKSGLNFLIAPDSSHELTVSALGQGQSKPESAAEKASKNKAMINDLIKQVQDDAPKNVPSVDVDEQSDANLKKMKKKKSKKGKGDQTLDVNKAARVTTVGAIHSAAKYARKQSQATDKMESEVLEKRKNKRSKGKRDKGKDEPAMETPDGTESKEPLLSEKPGTWADQKQPDTASTSTQQQTDGTESGNLGVLGEIGVGTKGNKTGFAAMNYPSKETKRFIACEEQWFEDINDSSVIQALLECPALLAINESGALDLNKWIEKYLLSTGMDVGPGDGVLLGELKNWNFVEELVPIQTVQMLNEASQNYLSMQRMYCPFYDTILFIFNNPMPKELTAESQFYFRLKTLPGLQHFLEYTIDDGSVVRWIKDVNNGRQLEITEQTSINALLSVIPEEWLTVPSIKYKIMAEHQRELSNALSSGSIESKTGKSFYGKIYSTNKGKANAAEKGSKSLLPCIKPPPPVADGEAPITPTEDALNEAEGMESESNDSANAVARTPSQQLSAKGSTKTKSETADSKPDSAVKVERRCSSLTQTGDVHQTDSAFGGMDNASHFDEHHGFNMSKNELLNNSLNLTCYDMGKRVAVVGNDTFFVFPMDGTVIRYDISTIEPEFRMQQLTITKKGHQSFFYPYYIPHEFDLSTEDYVVCPYFHTVLANGTIFAFQDLRAEEAAPYIKMGLTKQAQAQGPQLFSFEKVLFGKEVEKKLIEVAISEKNSEKVLEERAASAETRRSGESLGGRREKGSRDSVTSSQGKLKSSRQGSADKADIVANEKESGGKKGKKALKEKKSKKEKEKTSEVKEETKKKGKKEKGKKGKAKAEAEAEEEEDIAQLEAQEAPPEPDFEGEEAGEAGVSLTEDGMPGPPPPPSSEADEALAEGDGEGGEWMYPSSENSDDESETQKRRLFFAPPWDDAVQLMQPMTHNFTVTLPSGLVASVEDLAGPPLLRIVKQHYLGQGSARSSIEASRYYTMDGSVIKFLLNGNIQVLTARGVTTNIDELAVNSKRDTEDTSTAFGSASIVKIFNGEVILPNGSLWQVVNGKRVTKPPIYVFTTGPLAGGEVFRRRQDGVVYLHRYDGTVITHYPDGTRFTTRMVITEKDSPLAARDARASMRARSSISTSNVYDTPLPAEERGEAEEEEEDEEDEEEEEMVNEKQEVKAPKKNRRSAEPPKLAAKPRVKVKEKKKKETEEEEEETPAEPIEAPEEDEEFSDWVFVGLKYMIEHPNYSTVLFNSLSGNVHLKLPHGEWIRVFADGNVRISTEDQYCLDVDKNRAILSYPPCAKGPGSLPNLTAIRLWHAATREPEPEPVPEPVPAEEPVPSVEPSEPQEPDESEPPPQEENEKGPQKKKSRNVHHGKTLHPKVKAREGKHKNRATRLANLPAQSETKSVNATSNMDGQVESAEGESKKQSNAGNEESAKTDPASSAFPAETVPNATDPSPEPSLRVGFSSLNEFLEFNDENTFCKSVDSWDNRFLMTVYGKTVVDKTKKEESSAEASVQKLIETLSEHSNLPKKYISGILKNTSSENLQNAARRLQSIRKGYSDCCSGNLPNTKIFVVKRDLTAFQYLQKSQVDDEVTKAYGSRESMVIVDPVPKRQPRKFITIMRPVEEMDEPHGMWTRPYIEPMFRPRGVTNKHLVISTPNDLRWFGYTLKAAHGKRPKFVPAPKEVYKAKRSLSVRPDVQSVEMQPRMSETPEEAVRRQTKAKSLEVAESYQSVNMTNGPPGDDVSDPIKLSDEEGYFEEGDEEEMASEEEEEMTPRQSLKPESDKGKKKKKDKKGKEKEVKEKEVKEPELKKAKGKEKKGKGVKESVIMSDEEEDMEETNENELELEDDVEEDLRAKLSKSRLSFNSKLQALEPEIQNYPQEVEDIHGIYELVKERKLSGTPKILAKEHSTPCNTKKAVVVRAFVEIPKVDEAMQRALLAASLSYAETCKTEVAIYKTYKTEDPRSIKEKQKQTTCKQQLIEQNIDEMHLLEQKPGTVLRFHF